MNKHFTLLLLPALLFLSGCISKELEEAGTKAANAIRSRNFHVAKGKNMGAGEGSYKSLHLEFSNFEDSIIDFNAIKYSSVAALVFYQNLKPKDYEGYEKIKVELKHENTTTENIYDIKQLAEAERFISTADNFAAAVYSEPIDTLLVYIDTAQITASAFANQFYPLFSKVDSIYGSIKSRKFAGFKFDEIGDNEIPVILVWEQLFHEKAYSEMKIAIDIHTGKFIYLGLNQE